MTFILNDLSKRDGLVEVVDYPGRLDVQEDEFLSGRLYLDVFIPLQLKGQLILIMSMTWVVDCIVGELDA